MFTYEVITQAECLMLETWSVTSKKALTKDQVTHVLIDQDDRERSVNGIDVTFVSEENQATCGDRDVISVKRSRKKKVKSDTSR